MHAWPVNVPIGRLLRDLKHDLKTTATMPTDPITRPDEPDLNHPAGPLAAGDLRARLDDLAAQGLGRRLRRIDGAGAGRVSLNGRTLCCLCSNNYLGLAGHPAVVSAARRALEEWGWGAGGSRLVCGNTALHEALERRLAAFKNAEAALVFSTGYQANLAAVAGLAGRGDVVLLDKLDHASIIDAARSGGAEVRVFGHLDYARLEALLERYAGAGRRLIVTESVFSMDGDTADLERLVEIKERHRAMLCVDEAHATGVLGPNGRGLAAQAGVESRIDITVGTLSKALGGIGGFVSASGSVIEWLIQTARPFIYTTALPPAACAAALAALDVVESEPWRREKVACLAGRLRAGLRERLGVEPGLAETPIVPLIVGDARRATGFSAALEAEGFLVPAIRPPTVPPGTARLRISVSADHSEEDIDRLLEAVERHWDRARPVPGPQ